MPISTQEIKDWRQSEVTRAFVEGLNQAIVDKQNSCLTWDVEKLQFHQGYITAIVELLDSDFISKESV